MPARQLNGRMRPTTHWEVRRDVPKCTSWGWSVTPAWWI